MLNAQQARWNAQAAGYVPYHGSSYIQVVSFDDKGPVADAVLSYSQSADPASPHFADQTWLYSKKVVFCALQAVPKRGSIFSLSNFPYSFFRDRI